MANTRIDLVNIPAHLRTPEAVIEFSNKLRPTLHSDPERKVNYFTLSGCQIKDTMSEKDKEEEEINNKVHLELCPCGGGQSCIVARSLNAFVHEDHVFNEAKIAIRKNCFSELTEEQNKAMMVHLDKNNNPNSIEIINQEPSKIEN